MPGFELAKDYLQLAGQKLGPYVVLELASMGGVALVYRGEHESLHNQVAIKVLTPETVAEASRSTLEQLFLREAQILSQLRSEDILRAHDVGRALCPGDGKERPYMVVDWLHGHTFEAELERRKEQQRPFQLAEVLELLEPIARGLDVAHKHGIIHRDVNPRNFLLEQGAGGIVHAKLIDFGFAKAIAPKLTVQHVSGTLYAGSPDYSAPEHYDRERYGELSEMTDLYTLALSLVEALTLRPPLEGATPEALAFCTANPALRPTPRNRGAVVSDEVEALFAKALDVDQIERPGSVLDWWRELEAAAGVPRAPAPSAAFSEPGPAVIEIAGDAGRDLADGPEAGDGFAAGVPRPRPWARRVGLGIVGLIFAGGASAGVARFVPWPLACPAGKGDCNRRALDACETDIRSSLDNCGGCGHACPTGNATTTCSAARCSVVSCNQAGHQDCNASAADGCEADIETDVENCGACGKACSSAGADHVSCKAGTCEAACKKSFGDCDSKPENGCETDLDTNPAHCGRCDRVCSGTPCEAGLCAPKRLGTVPVAERLAAAGGRLYFWDGKKKQIDAMTQDGKVEVVAEKVASLVDLAAARDVVVWSTDKPARVWAMATSGGAPQPLGGVLPGATPLAVDASRGFIAWAARAPGTKPVPANKANGVAGGAFDASLVSHPPKPVACDVPVTTVAADADQTLCCGPGSVITAFSCKDNPCTPHRYKAACPESLAVDASWAYFPQGGRVLALDRKTGHVLQLAKVRGRARDLAFDSAYVYFIAGSGVADVLRVKRPGQDASAPQPELLARKQTGAAGLAVDDTAVYWTRSAEDGTAVVELPK